MAADFWELRQLIFADARIDIMTFAFTHCAFTHHWLLTLHLVACCVLVAAHKRSEKSTCKRITALPYVWFMRAIASRILLDSM